MDNLQIKHLEKNFDFYKEHFSKFFRIAEGKIICEIKAEMVLEALRSYFKDNKKIVFDYKNETYSHFLPEKILKTHDEIVEVYHAITDLFYGNDKKYSKFLLKCEKDTELGENAKSLKMYLAYRKSKKNNIKK